MQVYETARKLAQEIKESEEYINYKMAKEVMNLNTELKEKLNKFEKLRYEEQMNTLKTGMQNQGEIKHMQELYAELIDQEEARKYFEAELKFNILLGDVNKIISEAVKDIIK